jgi:hypothetical protein
MAPVTGGVTNGEKNGAVKKSGLSESLFSPGIPIYRLKSMLA